MRSAILAILLGLLLGSLMLATPLVGQRPSPWADLQIPAGVSASNVSQLGKLVVYREPQTVHVYSAFRRQWQSRTVSTAATTWQANDWLLIQDGNSWTAFSSMRGTFETLTVTGNATVANPPAQRNDSILLVVDTNQVHAFSGFTGTWVSRPLGGQVSLAVQRHVAVLSDGTSLLGMSAWTGRWNAITTPVHAFRVFADGTAGVAEIPGTVYGFSAQHDAWINRPALSGNLTFHSLADLALWNDGQTTLAYSGLQNTFATANTGPIGSPILDRQLAIVHVASLAHIYSAVTGTWTQIPLTPSGRVLRDSVTALLVDGPVLHAYSAVLGQVNTLNMDSSSESVTRAVAAAVERGSGRPWLFSAITGQWVQAPANALTGLPLLAAQAALLRTSNGWSAFSARTGSFFPVAAPASATPEVDPNSSLTALWDANDLHVFEARRGVWLNRPRTGSGTLPVDVWRTTLLAVDGNELIGYGAQAGAIDTAPMPQPLMSLGASSEVGHVLTQNHVLAFGSVGGVTSMWQFPEFRRVFTTGSVFQAQVSMPAGSFAFLGAGALAPSPMSMPGLGDVFLAPPVGSALLPTLPGEDRAVFTLPVPASPALRGTEWFFQALVLPSGGQPYLTAPANLIVL